MKRIRKVAVLGSGIMGSGIACHLANAGLEVLMLDILPKSEEMPRNSVAETALKAAIKSKPAPLFDKGFSNRITLGNFDDDLDKIKDCDWIIEVIIERLDIKQSLFEKVEQHRAPGSIITSNTSGIPIHMMAEGRSDDFKKHFFGTHFFNPPRYMRLLELIPTKHTDPALIEFFLDFGDRILGKETVLCKDTPAFIANRVGVFAMAKIFELTGKLGLSITDVDKLTGPAIGRPKTGTFRLGDLVGLDTAEKVIKGIMNNCPEDEQMNQFRIPKYLDYLVENKYFGNKSGQGFYKKTKDKDDKGRRVILGLNLETLAYEPSKKPTLESLSLARQIDNVKRRIKALYNANDAGGQLIKESLLSLFAYVSHRVPEITDDIYSIDNAIKAGFAWEFGPFEYWDLIGIEQGMHDAESMGYSIAPWVKDMLAAGNKQFYEIRERQLTYYDVSGKSYRDMPGAEEFIILNRSSQKVVLENDEMALHDIGEGVLCAEFRSQNNTIGGGVLNGLMESIQLAEDEGWNGLVIGNNAQNFTVGANLMLIGMMAFQKQFDQLEDAVKLFQAVTMRCRYSAIPVVTATQGYTFGGGCETMMHCDKVIASAESYIGLVEAGVGLIPGGGGTKEFALRASQSYNEGDVMIPILIEKLKTIAMASVATSAYEAYNLGFMRKGIDQVVLNGQRNIAVAKEEVIRLSKYYTQSLPQQAFVLGRTGLGALYAAINELRLGQFATDHDLLVAKKVADVLCGGDLTGPQYVSEQYLIELEREAFLSLCGEEKTLARIQYMLENKKPLRN